MHNSINNLLQYPIKNQLTTQLEKAGKILLSRYLNNLEDSLLCKLLYFKRHINTDNPTPKTQL